MELIRSHDALVRFVFGEPEQMAELLQAFLPPALVAAIDWRTLRRVDGQLVDRELRERRTDMVFEVQLHGRPLLLQLLHEHKSRRDRFTGLQVGGYSIRLLERWRVLHPDQPLPALLPFVVYHGERPWHGPTGLGELIDLGACSAGVRGVLAPLQPEQRFFLIDLTALSPAQVDALRVSAIGALTIRFLKYLRRVPPDRLAAQVLAWARLVHDALLHRRGHEVIAALFSWWLAGVPASRDALRVVMNRIQEENPPMRSLLDMVLDLGEERGVQKGMQQGMQQGLLAGRRAQLHELLVARFGAVPAALQAQLDTADAAALQRWGARLLTAPTLAAVFAD